jgi:methylmalonyl-CoA/ethylmalonyl-CoA epimerase
MILKIAHIGVAVAKIEEVEKLYTQIFSLPIHDRERDPDILASFIPVGQSSIELLQSTMDDGIIAKFIAKKGEGIHHIAFEVDNIEETLADLKRKGVRLVDQEPRKGAHNSKVAFLNPKGTYGILIELVEPEKNNLYDWRKEVGEKRW